MCSNIPNKIPPFKIDLVYLWVDGKDEKWNKIKQYWQDRLKIQDVDKDNSARFIENEELRYSIRSVLQNMPWINKIYIVTNGQVPEWLITRDNTKIQIIKHEQIMPLDALPTFSSCAIESCIANIPDLSEHFILANDDCFAMQPTNYTFFFTESGKPILRFRKIHMLPKDFRKSLYLRTLHYTQKIIERKYNKKYDIVPHHCFDAYTKSSYLACINEFKKEFDIAIYSKFRTKSVQRLIIALYMLVHKQCKYKIIDITKKNVDSHYINISSFYYMRKIINEHNPTLLCINDEPYVNETNRLMFNTFLTELFPQKMEYEIPPNYSITPHYQNKFAIIFSVDNNYAKIFAVALQSIINNSNPNFEYDLIVFEHNIKEYYKQKLLEILPENFNIRFIDTRKFELEFPDLKIATKNLYTKDYIDKLFIPYFMSQYNKVLYLDCDICANYDISKLFSIDFENTELLAVRDPILFKLHNNKLINNYFNNNLQLEIPYNYFNAGMLLFNLERFNIKEYGTNLKEAAQKAIFNNATQDILNIIFNKKVKLLPFNWNYMNNICNFKQSYPNTTIDEHLQRDLQATEMPPKIIHFSSIFKPWFVGYSYSNLFWENARTSAFYEEIIFMATRHSDIFQLSGVNPKIKQMYKKHKILSKLTFGRIKKSHKEYMMIYKDMIRKLQNLERQINEI